MKRRVSKMAGRNQHNSQPKFPLSRHRKMTVMYNPCLKMFLPLILSIKQRAETVMMEDTNAYQNIDSSPVILQLKYWINLCTPKKSTLFQLLCLLGQLTMHKNFFKIKFPDKGIKIHGTIVCHKEKQTQRGVVCLLNVLHWLRILNPK